VLKLLKLELELEIVQAQLLGLSNLEEYSEDLEVGCLEVS